MRWLIIGLMLISIGVAQAQAETAAVFQDDFQDGAINPSLWETNNMTWSWPAPGTWHWSPGAQWQEQDGTLTVASGGDYPPMKMLFAGDKSNMVYRFSMNLGSDAAGGIVLTPAPFGDNPWADALRFEITTDSPDNGVRVHRYDSKMSADEQVQQNGMFSAGTWYDVTMALDTSAGSTTITYDIDGIGSGSMTVPAISSDYVPTLYGRGAWGEAAQVSFDNVSVIAVPEPSAIVLLGIGAVSMMAYAWRKRTRTA